MHGGSARSVYASELIDDESCAACRAIDEQEYDSLVEALRDYPESSGGGYRRCTAPRGCCGSLVIVYDEAAPS